jgi:ABC-type nitrate/sulfonate/bicarbonate transport system substrate-binding protein
MSPQPWTRRRFLRSASLGGAVLFVPTLLAACGDDDDDAAGAATATTGGGGGATTGTVRTQLSWIKNVESGGMWVAENMGFFAEEGVQTEWFAGGPNAPTAESVVAGGTADVGMTTFFEQLIDAMILDDSLVMYATQFQATPLGLISLAESPVRTAADLVGKTVGGIPGNERYIETIFTVNGITPDFEFTPIGFDPQPLVEGAADVVFGFITNQSEILEEQGVDQVTVLLSEFGLPAYANVLFSTRSYIDANRDLLVRYLRALVKGWEANQADLDLGAQLAVDEYGADLGLSLEQQKIENGLQMELMVNDFTASNGMWRMDPAFIEESIYPWLTASGRTDLPDLSVSFDDTLLAEVFADGPTLLS